MSVGKVARLVDLVGSTRHGRFVKGECGKPNDPADPLIVNSLPSASCRVSPAAFLPS